MKGLDSKEAGGVGLLLSFGGTDGCRYIATQSRWGGGMVEDTRMATRAR